MSKVPEAFRRPTKEERKDWISYKLEQDGMLAQKSTFKSRVVHLCDPSPEKVLNGENNV